MIRKFMPAILAASLGMSGLALAATTTTEGVLKSIDMAKHEITLSDGTVILLPQGFKDPGLKVGEKVQVVWEMVNNAHQAESVTILK